MTFRIEELEDDRPSRWLGILRDAGAGTHVEVAGKGYERARCPTFRLNDGGSYTSEKSVGWTAPCELNSTHGALFDSEVGGEILWKFWMSFPTTVPVGGRVVIPAGKLAIDPIIAAVCGVAAVAGDLFIGLNKT